jgi:hypothetical protein
MVEEHNIGECLPVSRKRSVRVGYLVVVRGDFLPCPGKSGTKGLCLERSIFVESIPFDIPLSVRPLPCAQNRLSPLPEAPGYYKNS